MEEYEPQTLFAALASTVACTGGSRGWAAIAEAFVAKSAAGHHGRDQSTDRPLHGSEDAVSREGRRREPTSGRAIDAVVAGRRIDVPGTTASLFANVATTARLAKGLIQPSGVFHGCAAASRTQRRSRRSSTFFFSSSRARNRSWAGGRNAQPKRAECVSEADAGVR